MQYDDESCAPTAETLTACPSAFLPDISVYTIAIRVALNIHQHTVTEIDQKSRNLTTLTSHFKFNSFGIKSKTDNERPFREGNQTLNQ